MYNFNSVLKTIQPASTSDYTEMTMALMNSLNKKRPGLYEIGKVCFTNGKQYKLFVQGNKNSKGR